MVMCISPMVIGATALTAVLQVIQIYQHMNVEFCLGVAVVCQATLPLTALMDCMRPPSFQASCGVSIAEVDMPRRRVWACGRSIFTVAMLGCHSSHIIIFVHMRINQSCIYMHYMYSILTHNTSINIFICLHAYVVAPPTKPIFFMVILWRCTTIYLTTYKKIYLAVRSTTFVAMCPPIKLSSCLV